MCSHAGLSDVLLPPELASGRLARTFVDDHWCPVHGGDDRQHVHLLATELVTNAVRHGGPPITLTMECRDGDGVLLSVSDGSSESPEHLDVGPRAPGGRGVRLVDLLS
ncbi:MAG: ATP-binding protein, partial [Propionibacteriaceae bacterium]